MNIIKENLGPLDPIFSLDKIKNKGYNGIKQEPISALTPDTNSLYDPEHTEKYDEQSFLQGMYGDEEGKRLYQEEVKKQINDALKTIKSGEVLKSLSRSVPITDSAPTDNKIAQKPTETLTLRDPEHIENYDEESFLKGMYGDDEGAKIYKQQLATEKAETVTPPLQTAAVTMPKTSTIPSVEKLTDTTPAQSRVAVSDTTARAEAPLAPLAQVNYAVPPSTFLSTKNTTAPKTYAAASVGKTATSAINDKSYGTQRYLSAVSRVNNPSKVVRKSEPKEVLLRYAVEKAGGKVEWDEKRRKAVATIDGNSIDYDAEIINGRMVVDANKLANDFGKSTMEFETNSDTLFDSAHDAALAFGLKYRQHSDENSIEYGAIIVSKEVNGKPKYSYKNIVKSDPHPLADKLEDWKHGVRFDYNLEDGETLVATIHTHWASNSIPDFSDYDYQNTHWNMNSMYVVLPDSRFLYSVRTKNGFTKGVHIF